jgi:hypothetical protein
VSSVKQKLKHAFAVDPPGAAEPTAQQQLVVDKFCRWVAQRHLTLPGIIVMEVIRPLNWIMAQAGHFFSPGVWAVTPEQTHQGYKLFVSFLEQRGSIEYITRRIEHFEDEYEKLERARVGQSPSAGTDDDGGAEEKA